MTDSSVDMLVKPIPKSRRSKNPDEEWIELSQTPTVELQRSATINVTSDNYVVNLCFLFCCTKRT